MARSWREHERSEDMFTASEKKILMTKWLGDAYREFSSWKYDCLHYRLFQKTRCLITAYRADDKFIQPEGLANYVVALPSPLDPSFDAPVIGNDTATESEQNEAEEADDFEGEKEDFEVGDQQEEREQSIFDILISNLL